MKIRPFPRCIMVIPALMALILPLTALASGGGEGGAHEAGGWQENAWNLGLKFANFALIIFLLIKYLSKPLADYLSAKAEAIRSRLNELNQKKQTEEGLIGGYASKLQNIEAEVQRLKDEARREMEQEKEKIIAEAHHTAQEIIHHSHDRVKQLFAKAKADLHQEAVSLSLETAENLIQKNISTNDQGKLADEYAQRIHRVL